MADTIFLPNIFYLEQHQLLRHLVVQTTHRSGYRYDGLYNTCIFDLAIIEIADVFDSPRPLIQPRGGMKVVSFWRDQKIRFGLLLDNEIFEPGLAGSLLEPTERVFFSDIISFIRGGEVARETALRLAASAPAHAPHRLDQVKLAAPILPSTILCAGSNYREHNDEKIGSSTSGKEPEFFLKTSDSVIGPEEAIQYDEKLTRKLDCETELGIVIGTPGRHIAKERALKHVFGYTIVNDVTARDRQVRRSGSFTWYELGRGKGIRHKRTNWPLHNYRRRDSRSSGPQPRHASQWRTSSVEQYS
jgi:hypothetical protein